LALEPVPTINKNPGSGYIILGCLSAKKIDKHVGEFVYRDIKVLGKMSSLEDILISEVVDELIFTDLLEKIDNIRENIVIAEQMGITVRIMPYFQLEEIMFRPETSTIFIEQFVGLPTVAISSVPHKEVEFFIKSIIDYTGAFLGLIFLSPIFLILSILIKLDSEGKVFFIQKRCGLNGRIFNMFKFRSMIENAEQLQKNFHSKNEMDGPVFKIKNDSRITRLGKFMRKTSLDELPQLINVLRGEMSLVGPRPPIPEEVDQYKHWQRRKLSMKPGLTCLWQVSGRNSVDFERWMRLDLEYIDNWSLLLDIRLLLLTVKEVVKGNGN